jgi:hypothetical protein
MDKCRYEDLIDRYLLNKLKVDEETDFEEHYFICRSCFAKMSERSEIIQVLKEEGVLTPPQGERVGRSRVGTWFESLFAVLTPRRLALAGVSAAALLIAAWLLIPRTGTVPPPLILTGDETVRGATVEVVSPVKEVAEVPAFLEWKKAGEDFEYRVSLAGIAPLMSATTKDTRVVLPDEIKARMRPGQTYYWQVQAFKPDGTLVAASARIKFRIRAAH